MDLVADLFGMNASGAVGIESEISVKIFEECGIVFLDEMNVGEQTIDDRNIGC